MAFDNLVLQKLQDSLIVMLLPFEVILVQDEQLFEAVSFRLDFLSIINIHLEMNVVLLT